jgi:hypothetical protein
VTREKNPDTPNLKKISTLTPNKEKTKRKSDRILPFKTKKKNIFKEIKQNKHDSLLLL